MHLVCVVYVHVCVYLYVCVPASYSGEYTGSSLCTVDKLYTCKQSTHVHTLTVHVESLHHRQALHLQAEYNHKQCTHMHVVHVCVPVSYRGADTRGRVFCTSATSRSNRAWTHVYICVCMCACICMHIHHTCAIVYVDLCLRVNYTLSSCKCFFKFPSKCSLDQTRPLVARISMRSARGDVRFHARYAHTSFTDGTCRGVSVSASRPGFFSIPNTAAAAPTTPLQRQGLWLCVVQALATVHCQRFV